MEQKLIKLRFREDTAQNWNIANPVLSSGEPGFELDTGLYKIGNGNTAWRDLLYANKNKSEEDSNTSLLQSRITQLEKENAIAKWRLNIIENNITNIPLNDSFDLEAFITRGGSAYLVSNLSYNEPLTITKACGINLNSKGLTLVTSMQVNANLTITDGNNLYCDNQFMIINNGVVEINGGSFTTASNSIIKINNGECVINNGTFRVDDVAGDAEGYNTIEVIDNGSVIINGGEFYKFNPLTNPKISLGENLMIVEDGDWYKVTTSSQPDMQ